ncbi:hypothetical protein [Pseudomonas sp. LT1P18]|uniref:hypothetical protein n=1 Tax=Pseudomonas arabinosi TaxID=3398357 RepID=UPI0039EE749A
MIIKLLPQCRDDTLEVIKVGNVLTINGGTFDFSPMAEGATLPRTAIASEWFADDVTMQDGALILTLLLPLPANYSPQQAFPVPLVITADGPVVFPQPLPVAVAAAVAPDEQLAIAPDTQEAEA